MAGLVIVLADVSAAIVCVLRTGHILGTSKGGSEGRSVFGLTSGEAAFDRVFHNKGGEGKRTTLFSFCPEGTQ